ncbi:MAG: NAD(P)H-dependent oxidoreductase subunit E [Thermodesulfobacteriota bacterium]|nr:NAD(P)H-dependent oxidoreductase subunit E [Thermodesulfobacteriota bacterium]
MNEEQGRAETPSGKIPPEQWKKIDAIIDRYKHKQGTLIPVLKETQEITGFLPLEVQHYIAEGMKLHPSQIYGVVTFYSLFTMTPRGKHTVRVCMGTACYVRGGQAILDLLRKEFNVDVNQTTPDLRYTLEVINCPGTCGLAPVLCVNEDVHGIPEPAKALEILKNYT